MIKTDNVKDTEMPLLTIAYLESLIVPSKDIGFIYFAVCHLRKSIEEGGGNND